MSKTAQLVSEYVELWYRYKRYLVRRSELDNKRNKILILPDGTALDLTQMYIDTTDKHGNPLDCHRLAGRNPEYETFGQLPVAGTIKAIEFTKLDLYQVRLFYHPSGDHMDPSPDYIDKLFTLSTTSNEAINKVLSKLRIQKPNYPSSYQNDAVWIGVPAGLTPEQALTVLKTSGLKVVE